MSELIAAAVGTILGYVLGWVKDERAATRQRKAVATALLVELRDVEQFVENTMSVRKYKPDNDRAAPVQRIETPMLQQFYQNAYRFRPESVAALSDFYRAVRELQSLVASLHTKPHRGETALVSLRALCNTWEAKHTHELTGAAIAALKREGATAIPFKMTDPDEQESGPISA